MKLTVGQRKWLLSAHILFSAIWLGNSVVFVVLGIVSATTGDPGVLSACYTVMHLLSTSSLRASTIGTVVTGVLLSVLTSWGLFRYYWIIAKEGLTLLCILLGAVGMYFWTLRSVTMIPASGMDVWQQPDFVVNNGQLWVGIVLQVLSLAAMIVLSVWKPWGRRKRQ
ncbi:hypothetical protein [Paenibacillus tyrfis]|uniref:DUF2269 domain-containing protein n=1 Tax=Paenibacillus tyrfis TaxID=1501230 RepID=A0A081P2Z9_9BACL|nr:hypothetical protein [Paenibacillus tyrfis]KEQ25072.1 hypothetical protein ET33_05105 [Paenibacillus tyrfis]